jgi:hypothetical protein
MLHHIINEVKVLRGKKMGLQGSDKAKVELGRGRIDAINRQNLYQESYYLSEDKNAKPNPGNNLVLI